MRRQESLRQLDLTDFVEVFQKASCVPGCFFHSNQACNENSLASYVTNEAANAVSSWNLFGESQFGNGMKVALACIAVVGCCLVGVAQRPVFAPFDFSSGEYVLLMRPLQDFWTPNLPPPFYFKDVDRLNAIKATIKLRPKYIEPYRRAYAELSVLVCKKGQIEESMTVISALNILSVASTQKYYEFDGYFPMEGYEMAVERKDTFVDLNTALAVLDSLSRSKGLICILPPAWKVLDGEFTFTVPPVRADKEIFSKTLEDSIASWYPDEPFRLEVRMTSKDWLRGNGYDVTVKCRESLARKFDLYPRSAGDWKAYPLELVSYWEK
jgi:hypothetical protein